jgi:solute:Na+ symporter, SSS family
MHYIDSLIFAVYIMGMLGFGYYFFSRNSSIDDYFVGGRNISSWHIGLSVVATDVGGGFSIGLGGLGFALGISGSWMLFTGLIGAWLAAVFLIPRIKGNPAFAQFQTMPQVLAYFFDARVGYLAATISAIGYAGFTGSQLLAGAKLAHASFPHLDLKIALCIMGAVAVIYTVIGGIKAVIYTDTIQWILLMFGLCFIGIPMAYQAVGGWGAIKTHLPSSFFSFSEISWQEGIYYAVTIIPIWFVGMTLYQRIYASKDVATARKAWYIAGLFEWPLMAFMGVFLGMMARVAAEQGMFSTIGYPLAADMDAEIGLPLLLRSILPVGLMGLMMSAYFSAILSTADSCLMASSGNVISDLLSKSKRIHAQGRSIRWAQLITLLIGTTAVVMAFFFENVLDLMLYSYAFMVSGLLVPVLAALFTRHRNPLAACWAMLLGGMSTLILSHSAFHLPMDLNANVFGISISALTYVVITSLTKPTKK